ncbi:hypothetical protein B0H15DRAFT_851747 [Mycena belliarum]|uniref:Indole-diterpene biosynthesis protein PaxU n=1 Tax=Mycena belliarum TaxID=1033014 RepID=A0AAD6U0K1_9AGAR|nr:hypothetical protein B0H15DRAFT_851747 [Mycena belliae]
MASLTPLGPHAYIHRGATSTSKHSTDPTVVIIFGWMSAKLPHLLKYWVTYREIYPDATLILVRSHISFLWLSSRAFEARFRPVVDVLEALGCLENRQRILTHTFSNGGSFHLLHFARILSVKSVHTQSAPCALIIDSSPGGDSLIKLQKALTSPIRNRALRLLAAVCVMLGYCVIRIVLRQILRRPSPIQVMMAGMSRVRVLPWLSARSPRLYVYSKGDEMVPWTDVEESATRAAGAGVDVRMLRFEGSAHVAHARDHPGEYWEAVKKTWADACRAQNQIYCVHH